MVSFFAVTAGEFRLTIASEVVLAKTIVAEMVSIHNLQSFGSGHFLEFRALEEWVMLIAGVAFSRGGFGYSMGNGFVERLTTKHWWLVIRCWLCLVVHRHGFQHPDATLEELDKTSIVGVVGGCSEVFPSFLCSVDESEA